MLHVSRVLILFVTFTSCCDSNLLADLFPHSLETFVSLCSMADDSLCCVFGRGHGARKAGRCAGPTTRTSRTRGPALDRHLPSAARKVAIDVMLNSLLRLARVPPHFPTIRVSFIKAKVPSAIRLYSAPRF